jgi:hypothetical protein
MVDANIAFLNGDSFKGFWLIENFFNKPYVRILHILKNIYGVSVEGLDLKLGLKL